MWRRLETRNPCTQYRPHNDANSRCTLNRRSRRTHIILFYLLIKLSRQARHLQVTPIIPASENSCHPPLKTPVGVLPWKSRSEGKRPSKTTSGQSNPHKWLASRKIWSVESLRHYWRAKRKGHYTIDRLEERVVERGRARRSSLKGRERAVFNQTNTGTVLKAILGKLLRDGMERIWAFSSAYIPSWTELNWTEMIIWMH